LADVHNRRVRRPLEQGRGVAGELRGVPAGDRAL